MSTFARILLLVFLASMAWMATAKPAERSDMGRWMAWIATSTSRSEDDLLKREDWRDRPKPFFQAMAECSANTTALLTINDLDVSRSVMVTASTETAWDGKVALYMRRVFADGHHALSICLIDANDKLERTRLVRPAVHPGAPVEIDNSVYVPAS